MYRFIEENIYPKQKFIERAAKSASIQWAISTGKIISLTGMSEFPNIFNHYLNNVDNSELFIYDFVPKEIYLKVLHKTEKYLEIRTSNLGKKLVITFAINGYLGPIVTKNNILVHVYFDNENNEGQLKITSNNAAKKLNSKILIITEQVAGNKDRVCYAASMNEGSETALINKEYYVLRLLAKGYSSEEIASLQSISKHTVDDYRKVLLNKFKAKNVFQLIAYAYKEGYI